MELWVSAIFLLVLSIFGLPKTAGESVELNVGRSEQQLELLTSRFVELSNKLDAVVGEGKVDDLTTLRLTKSLDEHQRRRGPCEEHFFPCGPGPDGGVQCVRDYLVCDRSKDCKNGADEAEDLCKVRFPTPVTLIGHLVRNTCLTLPGSAPGSSDEWTIHKTETIPWFPSRPTQPYVFSYGRTDWNTGVVAMGAMELYGVYDYATGDVFIPWDPVLKLVGPCKFDPVSPTKTAYRCELSRDFNDLDKGKEPCYVKNWIWDH